MEHYKNLDLKDIVYFCEYDFIWKTEQWKSVKDYEGFYEVSDLGRIKSLPRIKLHKGKYAIITKEKILTSRKNRYGYVYICLFKDGCKFFYTIHQLVAIAFIPNIENKKCVNHKKGIKHLNYVKNLEWCTNQENVMHSIENGLTPTGSKHYKSKLTEEQVLEIRLLKGIKIYKEIAVLYKVSHGLIHLIMNNKVRKQN